MNGTEIIASGTPKLKALLAADQHPVDDLAVIANRIRARIRRTTSDIIAIGNDLIDVRDNRLEQGKFLDWIGREFGMTSRSAQLYMQAAKFAADRCEIISHLPPTTVYKLSSPSTPEPIKAEVIADLKAGRPVDHRAVEERIRDERAIARHRARLVPRSRRRPSKSPAAQKRRDARDRREAEQIAERDRRQAVAEIEALTIFEKLDPADLQRLCELFTEFGPYVVTQRLRTAT